MTDEPVVVVVDDEPDLADLYTAWLSKDCTVRTAYDGHEALELFDEHVDVALVDRLMPEFSGDELLARLREAGMDCRVAMVTAVEPDFDIVDMGFDAYLTKPVFEPELRELVDRLVTRGAYDRQVRELFALATKRALLETEKEDEELDESEAFTQLCRRMETVREEIDRTATELDSRDFEMTLRRLASDSG